MIEKDEYIKCKIRIKTIFYPKDLGTHEPGDFASFSAVIIEVKEGNPKTRHGYLVLRGPVHELNYSTEFIVTGRYDPHPQYGAQYTIVYMNKVINLQDPVEQRMFLEHILTENQVNLLYENLKNPFEVIKNRDAYTLCTVSGIGEKTANNIIKKYYDDIDNSAAYVALDSYGLSGKIIDKLTERYHGADIAIEKIRENPYVLIEDINGIGWKKADDIALNAGEDPQGVNRIKAYIMNYLREEAENGNTWTNVDDVASACIDELRLTSPDNLRKAINLLGEEKKIWWDENKTVLALTKIIKLEKNIANELKRLLSGSNQLFEDSIGDIDEAIKEAEKSTGFEYTEEQKNAIRMIASNNVSIVTGGAGTGKTSSVAGALSMLKNFSFAQTALSGRAASRLSEVTGVEGFTIHRLLGYDGVEGKFAHNKENTLPYSIIILDETSMVGAQLFYDLIQAIRTGAKLIMIGDDGQLESIGLCNVFKDMLNSGVVPTTRLTKIHRQAAKSAIITNSIKVRNGQQIIPQGWEGKEVRGELKDLELDIYFTGKDSQNHLLTQFRTLYNSLGRIDDIQIILPQKTRGEICTYKINDIVQSIVNPRGRNSVVIRSPEAGVNYILRENDRVIVNKNNYETKTPEGKICAIFNGNRGIIKKISKSKEKMIITFEQWGDIVIKKEDWNTIELGYALTCHKLQGSEANYVIIGMDYGARIMLTREWVYTAITRAKKKCILCAESGALSYAVANSKIPFKRTLLREFLCEQSINNKE